jgi:hypothetical protein
MQTCLAKMRLKVLLHTTNPDNLESSTSGPYAIETVHVNGTVTIHGGPILLSISTSGNCNHTMKESNALEWESVTCVIGLQPH